MAITPGHLQCHGTQNDQQEERVNDLKAWYRTESLEYPVRTPS